MKTTVMAPSHEEHPGGYEEIKRAPHSVWKSCKEPAARKILPKSWHKSIYRNAFWRSDERYATRPRKNKYGQFSSSLHQKMSNCGTKHSCKGTDSSWGVHFHCFLNFKSASKTLNVQTTKQNKKKVHHHKKIPTKNHNNKTHKKSPKLLCFINKTQEMYESVMVLHIAMLKIMLEEKKLDVKLYQWKLLRRDEEMATWKRIWILKLADWFCSEPARTPKNQFSAHYTELKVCVPQFCTGCFRKPWGCKVMLAPWEGA